MTPGEISDAEGDVIVSPHRCILIFSRAQISQVLPSNASRRVLAVASKYRRLEILVTSTGQVRGKDIAPFCGWLESIRHKHDIRWVFVNGEEELSRWVGWLIGRRDVDGDGHGIECLSEELTTVSGRSSVRRC
jgi:hypothetical protein